MTLRIKARALWTYRKYWLPAVVIAALLFVGVIIIDQVGR